MADPRKTISHKGLSPKIATFKYDNSTVTFDSTKADGSAAAGLAVKLSTSDQIILVSDGDPIFGKLLKVEPDGYCSVQYGGTVELPAGDGATVTAGSKIVGALGAASAKGYVRNCGSAGASPSQAEVNEILKARHTIWNVADTTKTVVNLEG